MRKLCKVLSFTLTSLLLTGIAGIDCLGTHARQEAGVASESSVGADPYDDMCDSVRYKILEAIDRTGAASVAVAVVKDGKIIWEEGFGWADREKGIKSTPYTMYRLASLSKAITATGLMVLVERGLVDLDKPANDYLGESKLTARVGRAEDATVKRILYHTAGLPMYWNIFDEKWPDRPRGMAESLKRYGILVTAPGEIYNYSNFGYGIIDQIIERTSGVGYSEFMRKEVFEPLGMNRTSVLVDSSLIDHVAQMYDERGNPISSYDFDHRGASAVLSSVHDLIRFGMFHLKDRLPDQKAILKDETIDRLHGETDPQFPDLKDLIGFDCLLGSFGRVDYGGYRVHVSTGWMPGAASRLALVPSEKIVTALVCNGSNLDLWPIEKAIIEAMLPGSAEKAAADEKEASEETKMGSTPPESFVGSWSGLITTYAGTIPVKIVFSEDGGIAMEMNGTAVMHLKIKTPLGEMGFRGNEFKGLFMGRFDTPDAARAQHVVLVDCRLRDTRLTGCASAVAVNQRFCLPYWMELKRLGGESE